MDLRSFGPYNIFLVSDRSIYCHELFAIYFVACPTLKKNKKQKNIDGVMVNMLASNIVNRGLKPWSGKTEDYKIGICCFSAKHAALRRKSKDWLTQNQDIMLSDIEYLQTVVSVS
jgi:hypothetical protein